MKYNSIGEQLIAKAQELDPNYKPDKFNDMSEAIDVILNNTGSDGGITTANINSETFQLDTSSLTTKDQYVLASMDDGEGNIQYIPLQTYFFNTGYFNKEVKMQNYSGGFSLALSNISFSSADNYTLNAKNTNVDFTSSLDSSKTWNKKGELKYITIEEQNIFTGENTYDYLEIEAAASNKIWFDVRAIGDVYLTEEQYNTLVSYAKNDLLAGINANGFFIPLQGISDINSSKPTLTFEGWYLSIGLITITINSEDRKVDFIAKSVLMSPTTSPSSQVIPSITTSNTQQNLTIGNGLTIENGALKTTIPPLPSDASTKTYVLKAVNGVLT